MTKGCRQKKHSIFVDIVQIGGGKVNPISKNVNEIIDRKAKPKAEKYMKEDSEKINVSIHLLGTREYQQ